MTFVPRGTYLDNHPHLHRPAVDRRGKRIFHIKTKHGEVQVPSGRVIEANTEKGYVIAWPKVMIRSSWSEYCRRKQIPHDTEFHQDEFIGEVTVEYTEPED